MLTFKIDSSFPKSEEMPKLEVLQSSLSEHSLNIGDSKDNKLGSLDTAENNVKESISETSFLVRRKKGIRALLKDRKDVILKSILRSIKRLLTLAYTNSISPPRFHSKYRKNIYFEKSVRKFTGDLNLEYAPVSASTTTLEHEERLSCLFAYLINEKAASKTKFKKVISVKERNF